MEEDFIEVFLFSEKIINFMKICYWTRDILFVLNGRFLRKRSIVNLGKRRWGVFVK